MGGEIANARKCAQCDVIQSVFLVPAAEGIVQRAGPL